MWSENDMPKQDEPIVSDWVKDMIDFETKVIGSTLPIIPTIPSEKIKLLRKSLITEEVCETIKAIDEDNIVEVADGIVDSIVVLIGTALAYGIDIRPVWNEVHKTNMAKIGGKTRKDGKRLKPEGWKPPNIEEILEKQGWKK